MALVEDRKASEHQVPLNAVDAYPIAQAPWSALVIASLVNVYPNFNSIRELKTSAFWTYTPMRTLVLYPKQQERRMTSLAGKRRALR